MIIVSSLLMIMIMLLDSTRRLIFLEMMVELEFRVGENDWIAEIITIVIYS